MENQDMSRSEIRTRLLPTDLVKARFSTIAKDARFRSLFAPGDTAKSIAATLKRLFNASDANREDRRIRGEAAIRRRKIRENDARIMEIEKRQKDALNMIATRIRRNERLKRRDRQTRVRKLFDSYQRGFTYTIGDFSTGAAHSTLSPSPWGFLWHICQQHRGKRIRVVAYNGTPGEIVRSEYTVSGELIYELRNDNTNEKGVVSRTMDYLATETKVGDQTYTIPDGNISRWFNGKDGYRRIAKDWLFTYSTTPMGQPEALLHPGDTVRVYISDRIIEQATRIQYFAQGVSHCLIQPIINDLEAKRAGLKNPSKQSLSNYNRSIDKLGDYAAKYEAGIPIAALHTMVEDVSKSHHINIDIKVPCAKKGEDQFIKIDNQYAHGRRYEFVNWRFDHVDALEASYKDVKNGIEVSRETISQLIKEYTTTDRFCEWSSDSLGPVCVCTSTETYRCNVQFTETYVEFCKQFSGFRIDHVVDTLMSKFVLEGAHWCCAARFNATATTTNLRCFDMKKSYASFHESRFYEECKFPSKLTVLRPIDRIMGPGMYRINNLNWSTADPKFTEICHLYGDPFRADNVYVVPLLKLLDHFGVKYDVTMGLWAGGAENTFDFRFDDELIESKEYALIVGKWAHLKHEDVSCIKGTKEFAGHLQSTSANCNTWWMPKCDADPWASEEGTIQIRYPRKHVWHMTQFSAYINAYEFIKLTDQLMLVDLHKVVQVQKDDFICEDHDFQLLEYMSDKTHELFETNDSGVSKLTRKLDWDTERTYDTEGVESNERPCYLSGLWQVDGVEPNPVFTMVDEVFAVYRERYAHIDDMAILPHPVMSLDGPGGTGKTDYLLWAMKMGLLQRCVYIAQSHKLGRAKADEYKLIFSEDCDLESFQRELTDRKDVLTHRVEKTLQITVWARALHDSPEIWGVIHRYANVLIFDEVSMMHCETVKFLMARFAQHQLYFCGDPGFQLAAYKTNRDDDEVTRTPYNAKTIGIPSYTFSKIFRVKDERLMAIRLEGRAMLERGTTTMSHGDYRTLHDGTQFPAEWGRYQNGKPGPVAGMSFFEAESVVWYVEKVAKKCTSTRGLMHKFRRFVDRKFHYEQPISVDEIEAFYMTKFTTVNTMEEAGQLYQAWEEDNGKFSPRDMIICSTNEFADEWTRYLTPLQPSTKVTTEVAYKQGALHEYFKHSVGERNTIEQKLNVAYAKYLTAPDSKKTEARKTFRHYSELSKKMKAGRHTTEKTTSTVKLQKWKMLSTSRDYSNGQIVVAETPPMDKCVLTHAFTAHSTIGETARGKVFIDRRNMFEIEHWETIVGRAKRWEDIVIVNLADPDPADKYANTKMYCISSKKGQCCYIGHTTLPTVEQRGKQHFDDYKTKRKQCTSRLVLKFKDWQIDLIEDFPCASKRQAETREQYHMDRAENCVNRRTTTDKRLPACAITKRKAAAAEKPVVVEVDPKDALRWEIEERLTNEARSEDEATAAIIALHVHEEQQKRKAAEATDDRFDANGNLKKYSFEIPSLTKRSRW